MRALRMFLSLTALRSVRWAHSLSSAPTPTPRTSRDATSTRTLYDMPVSNNGARCRLILYKKQLDDREVSIQPPTALGGLRSAEYLRRNPQGKMPLLSDSQTGLHLAESDTIARYLLSEYVGRGPSFQPDHPVSNLIARIHDLYLTTIQGCLYKPAPPFGTFGTRDAAIHEYVTQLQIIDNLIAADNAGPYLLGAQVALADATLFPSLVFAVHMLPKFDVNPPLPPNLSRYYQQVTASDFDFARVQQEIQGGLDAWEQRDRWVPLLGAGWRDTAPSTIFDKISTGEIPATIVEQADSQVLAFKDIEPAAPAHVLVIPKHRHGLTRLSEATVEHTEILGRLLVAASTIAKDSSLGFGDGARIVINDGADGGQEVMHLHVHVLGGRQLSWPPG